MTVLVELPDAPSPPAPVSPEPAPPSPPPFPELPSRGRATLHVIRGGLYGQEVRAQLRQLAIFTALTAAFLLGMRTGRDATLEELRRA